MFNGRFLAMTVLGFLGTVVGSSLPVTTQELSALIDKWDSSSPATIRKVDAEAGPLIEEIAKSDLEPFLPTIDRAFEQPNNNIRVRLIKLLSLAAVGNPLNASLLSRESEKLVSFAGDSDSEVRAAALSALSLMQPKPPQEALPVAVKSLNDQTPGIQIAAIELLLRFSPNDPDVNRSLLNILRTGTAAPVRSAVVRALSEVKRPDPTIIVGVTRALSDTDISVRQAALTALAAFGPQARPALGAVTELANSRSETTETRRLAKAAIRSIEGR